MTYRPQPDTLEHRVCAWFMQHRDEELRLPDLIAKFGVEVNQPAVRQLLAPAVAANWLAMSIGFSGRPCYRAGYDLPQQVEKERA